MKPVILFAVLSLAASSYAAKEQSGGSFDYKALGEQLAKQFEDLTKVFPDTDLGKQLKAALQPPAPAKSDSKSKPKRSAPEGTNEKDSKTKNADKNGDGSGLGDLAMRPPSGPHQMPNSRRKRLVPLPTQNNPSQPASNPDSKTSSSDSKTSGSDSKTSSSNTESKSQKNGTSDQGISGLFKGIFESVKIAAENFAKQQKPKQKRAVASDPGSGKAQPKGQAGKTVASSNSNTNPNGNGNTGANSGRNNDKSSSAKQGDGKARPNDGRANAKEGGKGGAGGASNQPSPAVAAKKAP